MAEELDPMRVTLQNLSQFNLDGSVIADERQSPTEDEDEHQIVSPLPLHQSNQSMSSLRSSLKI